MGDGDRRRRRRSRSSGCSSCSAPPSARRREPRDAARRARRERTDQRLGGDGGARGGVARGRRSRSSRRPRARSRCATGCGCRSPAATTSPPAAGSASGSPPRVGVQLAQPERPVVCVLGEGSAQYGITALWTAAAYRVPVTFLVLRNEEYMILKWFAELEQVDGRPGLDLKGLDVASVARGLRGALRRRSYGPRGARRGAARGDRRARTARGWCRCRSPPGCGWSRAAVTAGRVTALGADVRRIAPAGGTRRSATAPPTGSPHGTPEPLRGELLASARPRPGPPPARSTSSATPPTRARTARSRGRWRSRATSPTCGGCSRWRAAAARRSSSAPAARASTGRPRPTASWSTSAATGSARRSRTAGRPRAGPAGRAARARQPACSPATAGALGPDPASTDIACVGRRGRQQLRRDALRRPRRLLQHACSAMTFVLANGTVIDTAAPDAEARLRRRRPELARGLSRSARSCSPTRSCASASRASSRSRTRPATGCARSSTPTTPLEIFRRLIVGSEGTLAFVAEAVFETVPLRPHTTLVAGATSRTSTRPPSGARAGRGRREGDRADGRPDADRRRLEHARHARALEGAAARVGGAAGRVPRRRRSTSSTSPRRRRSRSWPASELLGGAALHARARARSEMLWHVREGMHGLLAAMRAPGRAADHRGRVRAARAGRRRRPRTCRRLLGKHGFLHGRRRPRLGRQPALPADAELRRARRPRALRRLHARAGRADRRQVRRLAEGRARHRREHGPLRRARVGREGDRDDVAGQAARRPGRDPRARRRCSTATRAPTCAT